MSAPAPPAAWAVRTEGLSKSYGEQLAVDSLDLRVPAGAVFGFLGPNGSGKTTTIRMLLGLARPSAGSAEVLGTPMPDGGDTVLSRVGALVEGPAFHPYLTGRANLVRLDAADRTVDPATATQRIDAALERVGLSAAAGKRFRAYSLGMKQRLAIASALLRPRDLLVLDEPTNGLDPQGTREVRTLVGELAADGTTVVVSSHLLSEIEQMCDHVAVMHLGRLLRQGSIAEVRAATGAEVVVETRDPAAAAASLQRQGLDGVRTGGDRATAALAEHHPEDVVAALVADGVPVRAFRADVASLEDVFVSLTGEGFDVGA